MSTLDVRFDYILTGFGLRSALKLVRLFGIILVYFLENVVQELTASNNFHSGTSFVAFEINDCHERFTHFRHKEHPGDVFRGTVILPLPDPYKDQKNFWIWFRPCFQTSHDVDDLNDLYK